MDSVQKRLVEFEIFAYAIRDIVPNNLYARWQFVINLSLSVEPIASQSTLI